MIKPERNAQHFFQLPLLCLFGRYEAEISVCISFDRHRTKAQKGMIIKMARMILKWRYLKMGNSKHNAHLVKYIATREGAEKCDASWKHQPATLEQQKLAEELARDFPDTKNSLEYTEYIALKTKSAASEFINYVLDENIARIVKKENYVGYIAMRPRVEKQGAHGLFSQEDGPINLSKVADEVANHDGVVWTTILSLRQEDAEKLGYDHAKAWKDMLRSQSDVLASSMGIPLADLRWYAAFHNESYHPHVHIIAYSVGTEPYMTEQGLMKMKSQFAKEIFKQELYHIYEEQTLHREELRQASRERIEEIVEQSNSGVYENETVELMLKRLADELDGYTGKKVYGYLPKPAKNLINGIVDELAKDERIAALYELWYNQRDAIVRIYQDRLPERIPLSQNKEFKSIRNAVLQEALKLSEQAFIPAEIAEAGEEQEVPEVQSVKENMPAANSQSAVRIKSRQSYPQTSVALASVRLFGQLARMIQDDISKNDDIHFHTEKKLQQKIVEKKLAQGIKLE